MQTRTYQIYTAAAQSNAASALIIASGILTAVCWTVHSTNATDATNSISELSFMNAGQQTVDGAQGVIDHFTYYQKFTTSGFAQTAAFKQCMGLYIPVAVGQRIYLNTSGNALPIRVLLLVQER